MRVGCVMCRGKKRGWGVVRSRRMTMQLEFTVVSAAVTDDSSWAGLVGVFVWVHQSQTRSGLLTFLVSGGGQGSRSSCNAMARCLLGGRSPELPRGQPESQGILESRDKPPGARASWGTATELLGRCQGCAQGSAGF